MKCSIICNTFNHEKTIAKAIESFLMQKTNFPFEILIHDDASEDKTQEIIESYIQRFPGRIDAIFQDENMTQKGYSVTEINSQRARGEYITYCEGDDYWTSPNRLQIMVDILDYDQSIMLVGHASRLQNFRFPFLYRNWNVKDGIMSFSQIVESRGIIFSNNAVMIRANHVIYPEYSTILKVQDTKRVIFAGLKGKVYALSEIMSVYQQGIPGSWTDRTRFNVGKLLKHYQSEYTFFQNLDRDNLLMFHDDIKKVLDFLDYWILLLNKDLNCFHSSYHHNLTVMIRVKNRVHFVFPKMFSYIARLRYLYFI